MKSLIGWTAACAAGILLTSGSTSAQQMRSPMFNVDTYWKDYWSWYDTEYVPSYRTRTYSYPGASPAISGAPDAGGDYGDYASDFYVPGGASEWYGRHLRAPRMRPSGDPSSGERRRPNLGEPGLRGATPLERTPSTDAISSEGGVQTRTPTIPRAGQDPDAIPSDLDAAPRSPAPVTEAEAEIWY